MLIDDHVIDTAAHRLSLAAANRRPCAPVRDLIGVDDVDAAYRVQSRVVDTLLQHGRTIVGRKIGLTSRAVQRQLRVDSPDFGVLLDDLDCTGHQKIDTTRLLQPRIEAEIAFTVGQDIACPTSADEVAAAVDRVWVAFEIVDSRIAGWDITLGDTVADNASCGLFVLGDSLARDEAPDLAAVTMTMSLGGQRVSTGTGSDCMGSPWEALAWLANTSLHYGSPLRAGEIVLSGALGPMVPVTPGSHFTAEVSGIGSVEARFSV